MPDLDKAPWPEIGKFASGTAVPILVIIIFAVVFLALAERFLGRLVRRLIDREALEGTAMDLTVQEVGRRIETVSSLARSLVRVLVVTIAVIMVLGKFNVDIGPAVAGLGIVGIAVGFGAQSLVKDYFNGVLILVENQFARGDVVSLAGVTGTVEDFTLRRTTLRDADGTVHTIPNGEIRVTSNLTRAPRRPRTARSSELIQAPDAGYPAGSAQSPGTSSGSAPQPEPGGVAPDVSA